MNQYKNDNQLLELYLRWKEDPKTYESQMLETVSKVIHFTLGKMRVKGSYRSFEEYEDLKQDILFTLYRVALPNIKNPTNKRIFNYLKYCVIRYVQQKKKSAITKNTKELDYITEERTSEYSMSCLPEFGDPQTQKIAELLSMKYTRKEIKAILSIKSKDLQESIEKIKEYYG